MCLFQQHVVRRWKKRPTGDWIGIFGGYLWIMKQEDNFLKYHVVEPCIKAEPTESPADKKAEIEDCSHYEQMLKDYFQLDVDLESLYQQWSLADPNFQKIAKNYVGVRMLRQDPVENLFAFICSSNNNIQRSVFLVSHHHSIHVCNSFPLECNSKNHRNGGKVVSKLWESAADARGCHLLCIPAD